MFVSLVAATAAALAPAPLAKVAIDQGIRHHDVGALDVVVVVFLISAVVYAVATYAQTYLVGWVGQRALQDLRMKLFSHLQSLSLGFYSRNRAGVLISRMTNDVEALDQLVEDGLATLIQSSLTLIGVVVILLVLDFHLALLTFIALPILAVGALAFRIASADAYRLTREKIASITAYLQETLSGIRVVRAFGQEPQHIARFRELNDENRDANMTTVNLNAAYFPAVELLSALVTVEILVIGGIEAINGHTSTGVVFAFIAALNNFFDPIQQLSQLYTTYQSGMAALDKIFGLLAEEPEIVDAPDAVELPRIRGELRFDDVSFRYGADDDGAWALRDIDLVIPPGQTVALVGETGAGKSTFAKLVARFYDPTEGRRAGRRPRPALGHRPVAALADGDGPPGGLPVQRHRAREHRVRAPVGHRRGDPRRAPARSAPTTSSWRWRTATTPRSASAACSCPPASASWWPSPGRWWPTRGSWCSTRRPPTSTSTPRA